MNTSLDKIKVRANAKINLALDIIGVRPNGYHELDMIMSSVDIFDIVECKRSDTISVLMDNQVADIQNTAYKCAKLILEKYGYAMSINITKNIPFGAGLGGSSADASAVLWCAKKLFGIDMASLRCIAEQVGSDVVYMMSGGYARVQGVGDIIESIELPQLNLVIAQKLLGVSTALVYKEYDKNKQCDNNKECDSNKQYDNNKECDSINDCNSNLRNSQAVYKLIQDFNQSKLFNVLEQPAIKLLPEIKESLEEMKKYTPNAYMTGSGSAVFGIFDTMDNAQLACEQLKDKMAFCKAVKTLDYGIKEIK